MANGHKRNETRVARPESAKGVVGRHGLSLVEVTVAAVVAIALVVMLGQAVGWVAIAQRDIDLRQLALFEAGNVMEHFTALPFNEVTAERAREIVLSDHARQLLGDDSLQIDVQTLDENPPARRITVAVQYKDTRSAQSAIRLTAWVYERGGQ